MKEFCDRCRSASRSVQTYIHSTNPTPDEDTLTTLIETNDELSVALSKHHHAFLRARKMTGGTPSPSPSHSSGTVSATASGARPLPPPPRNETQSPSTSNGTPSASGARPMPPPRNDVQSPSASGTASAPGARLPQAQTTRSPEPDPAPAPITASPPSTTTGANTYEYRSEDFQVQNPFADSFATEQTNPRGDEMNTQRPAHVA